MSKSKGRVCIILLNWNGKKDTLECLESLSKITYKRFQVIVVDNGSVDDSVEAFRKTYPSIPILKNKENLGFASGNNVGIRWALRKPFEWIFLLNNDTTVDPSCLTAFLEAAEKKQAKLLGAKIYHYHDPQRIDHLGGFWNPQIAEFECPLQGKIDDGTYEDMRKVDYVSGCAFMIHRTVLETVGLLESNFFLYWEESDYCFRAKKAGFDIWTAPQAKVYHKISASFIGGKPHMHYFWWRSRLLWISRNCTNQEKYTLYKRVIIPELVKCIRHYLLKNIQHRILCWLGRPDADLAKKIRRYKAGLTGIAHYFLKKFGNCPKRVSRL